jgi:hypothetical protein
MLGEALAKLEMTRCEVHERIERGDIFLFVDGARNGNMKPRVSRY